MYRQLHLLTFLITMILFCNNLMAQHQGTVIIQSVEEVNEWQVITLLSDQPFIIGANRYVLYIGELPFFKSNYPDGNVSIMQFYLTKTEFAQLKDGAPIRLSYGLIRENSDGLPDFTSPNPIIYEVGNWKK